MERSQVHTCPTPDVDATLHALRLVAAALGTDVCWHYQGRFHFKLSDAWTLAIRPESAGRFRVETCRWTVPRSTLWAFAGDDARLVSLVCDVVTQQIGEVA
jgi:hypothetical protein